jgi:hypothetical protein
MSDVQAGCIHSRSELHRRVLTPAVAPLRRVPYGFFHPCVLPKRQGTGSIPTAASMQKGTRDLAAAEGRPGVPGQGGEYEHRTRRLPA